MRGVLADMQTNGYEPEASGRKSRQADGLHSARGCRAVLSPAAIPTSAGLAIDKPPGMYTVEVGLDVSASAQANRAKYQDDSMNVSKVGPPGARPSVQGRS